MAAVFDRPSNCVPILLAISATSCSALGTGGAARPPTVQYADCEIWGQKGFDYLECVVVNVAGVNNHRLEFVRDDGLTVVPQNMTLERVKEQFPDVTTEDRGAGRLLVKAGGLEWSFHEGQSKAECVGAYWEPRWRVRSTDNGRELSFPCSLNEVVKVLGRDGYTETSREGKRKL